MSLPKVVYGDGGGANDDRQEKPATGRHVAWPQQKKKDGTCGGVCDGCVASYLPTCTQHHVKCRRLFYSSEVANEYSTAAAAQTPDQVGGLGKLRIAWPAGPMVFEVREGRIDECLHAKAKKV